MVCVRELASSAESARSGKLGDLRVAGTLATAGIVSSGVVRYEGQKGDTCLSIDDPLSEVSKVIRLERNCSMAFRLCKTVAVHRH